MIELGPQTQAALREGLFLHSWCIDFQLNHHWRLSNSALDIGHYSGNGVLGQIEAGVLDGSRKGETRTIELRDSNGALFADLTANWSPGVVVSLYMAFCHPDTYATLDGRLYLEFQGFIESYEQIDVGVVSMTLKSQLVLDYVKGRRSNSASVKSHFPADTSHDRLGVLPKNIQWGSVKI